jgi:hypothetical protein
MVPFIPNMELPQSYVDAIIKIALENNMTAEQFARNIIARHLEKTYSNYLTQN